MRSQMLCSTTRSTGSGRSCRSGLSDRYQHARAATGRFERALATVDLGLCAAGEHVEHPLDALHSRSDERAVAIVRLTAARSALGAFGPATLQCSGRLAPGEQPLEALVIGREIHHAAQRAALVLGAHERADERLARLTCALQSVDIVRDQQLVLAIEQGFELRECSGFLGEQL